MREGVSNMMGSDHFKTAFEQALTHKDWEKSVLEHTGDTKNNHKVGMSFVDLEKRNKAIVAKLKRENSELTKSWADNLIWSDYTKLHGSWFVKSLQIFKENKIIWCTYLKSNEDKMEGDKNRNQEIRWDTTIKVCTLPGE